MYVTASTEIEEAPASPRSQTGDANTPENDPETVNGSRNKAMNDANTDNNSSTADNANVLGVGHANTDTDIGESDDSTEREEGGVNGDSIDSNPEDDGVGSRENNESDTEATESANEGTGDTLAQIKNPKVHRVLLQFSLVLKDASIANIRECLNDFAVMLNPQTLLPLINKLHILSNRLDDHVTQKEDVSNILEELVMAEQLVPEQEDLKTYFVKNLENKVAEVIQMLDELETQRRNVLKAEVAELRLALEMENRVWAAEQATLEEQRQKDTAKALKAANTLKVGMSSIAETAREKSQGRNSYVPPDQRITTEDLLARNDASVADLDQDATKRRGLLGMHTENPRPRLMRWLLGIFCKLDCFRSLLPVDSLEMLKNYADGMGEKSMSSSEINGIPKQSNNVMVYIGTAVAAIVLMAIIAALAYYLVRRNKVRKKQSDKERKAREIFFD